MSEERSAQIGGRHLDLLRIDAVRAGEGTDEERSHVAGCPECRATLDLFQGVASELRSPGPSPVEVPPGVEQTILAEYRRAFGKSARVRFISRQRWYVPAFATAAAAGLALVLALSSGKGPALPTREAPGEGRTAVATVPPPGRADDAPSSTGAARSPGAGSAPDRATVRDRRTDILAVYRMALEAERRAGTRLAWSRGAGSSLEEQAVDAAARKAVAL